MKNIKDLIVPSPILSSGCFTGRETKKEYYDSGGLLARENYKNGKQEGLAKSYYENGKLHTEENYKNGLLEGLKKVYFESGKLGAEVDFVNGKTEGL